MKILRAAQIRELDNYTIEHEPLPSIDLMERASRTFVQWFSEHFHENQGVVQVYCGPGNNGGDGLAIARLLHERFYHVRVVMCRIGDHLTADCAANLDRLYQLHTVSILELAENDPMPELPAKGILIDAIFGSGLNRPLEGYWAALIQHLNTYPGPRVAVDIPSGIFADGPTQGAFLRATHTMTFETPKYSFVFPESHCGLGDWEVRSIGLHKGYLEKLPCRDFLVMGDEIQPLVKTRDRFAHKGTYGHALLIAGSYGKVGAALLAGEAALRTGCGLVTVHAPRCAYPILQIGFPEGMVSIDQHEYLFSQVDDLSPYKAIGIGCGLGQNLLTAEALRRLLENVRVPLALDADALNILAANPLWLSMLPRDTILTPHPGEFERLFGKSTDSFARNELQRQKASELGVLIVLKGAFTCIATPDGNCYFNSTGNPGMATGGSGDALTGMIISLLAQGYTPREAAILGVYLHGLAGDLAAAEIDQEALLARDIIRHIGGAFHQLRTHPNGKKFGYI